MTDLEFTIKVKNELIWRMDNAPAAYELCPRVHYLCNIANKVRYTFLMPEDDDKCYVHFMVWIKEIGQMLLDTDNTKHQYFRLKADVWNTPTEMTSTEMKNQYRLDRLNEYIKALEEDNE